MSGTSSDRHILLVEDSPTDQLIAIEALRAAHVGGSVDVVETGVEVLAYLRQEGRFASVPRPALMLLDLHLPRKDGREVLREMKSDPALRLIPVVVLTTSRAEEDVRRAYADHANSYVTKPMDFQQFSAVLSAICHYWFDVVTLPGAAPLAVR